MNDKGFRLHREKNFENAIVQGLEAAGWVSSPNDTGYDRVRALYPEDIFSWLRNAYPKKYELLVKRPNWQNEFLDRIVLLLNTRGTIGVVRDGAEMSAIGNFNMSQAISDDAEMNPDIRRRCEANILRVVQQVHFSTTSEESIDLVLFLNGIPVATIEVKTNFTQSVDAAVDEYKTKRIPNRGAPLLVPERGAIVHFAMSETDIKMTTKLAGNNTFFLPFNKGWKGHAANAPATPEAPYPVSYFWEEVAQKEAWLDIWHHFVFVERDVSKKEVKTKLIFPRFHQWRAVTKMIADASANGPGMRYLIEHSAGSGKTKTITWTAFQLTELRKGDQFLFDSVIIVTDRTILDKQLADAVRAFNRTPGLVSAIGAEKTKVSHRRTRQGADRVTSKSTLLADELSKGKRILTVTLQTFPHAMKAIIENPRLSGKSFAVIFDEAHNSQTGSNTTKLRTSLSLSGKSAELPDDLEARLIEMQNARSMPTNVSFFAFTATPKHVTVELFGRPKDPTKPESDENLKQSFDLYSMRQAIEEGFILDVMKGYLPYKTAYYLTQKLEEEKRIDPQAASSALAKWKSHHPTNIVAKTKFIIEHFVKNVAHLLDGRAKAMIVTSSRAAVVRYKHAFDDYLQKHPGLNDKVKLMVGIPLVAFSGEVKGVHAIERADKNDLQSPFLAIDENKVYTEKTLNPKFSGSIEDCFDTDEYRLLIVANKFQTGFDQPKLCAMYIDKTIGNDVEIVQTYSRLNRTYPKKDRIYIVDFVNDPENVARAFKRFDNGVEIMNVQDPNVIYDLQHEILDAGIFARSDVDAFKTLYLKTLSEQGEANHDDLFALLDAPARTYNERLEAALENWRIAEEAFEQLKIMGDEEGASKVDIEVKQAADAIMLVKDFRRKLRTFGSMYGYICQLAQLNDADIEIFSEYVKYLGALLDGIPRHEVDLSNVALERYALVALSRDGDQTVEVPPMKPMTTHGAPEGRTPEYLRDILDRMNQLAGDIPMTDAVTYFNGLADTVREDEFTMQQIKNNKRENALQGALPDRIDEAIYRNMDSSTKLSSRFIGDPTLRVTLAELIYDLLTHDRITPEMARKAQS